MLPSDENINIVLHSERYEKYFFFLLLVTTKCIAHTYNYDAHGSYSSNAIMRVPHFDHLSHHSYICEENLHQYANMYIV